MSDAVAPLGPGAAEAQVRRPATSATVPIVVAGALTVLFVAVAWFAVGRGVITDTWPAFLPDTDSTSITRYSGPWLTLAALAVLGAGLSVTAMVRRLAARSAAGEARSEIR